MATPQKPFSYIRGETIVAAWPTFHSAPGKDDIIIEVLVLSVHGKPRIETIHDSDMDDAERALFTVCAAAHTSITLAVTKHAIRERDKDGDIHAFLPA